MASVLSIRIESGIATRRIAGLTGSSVAACSHVAKADARLAQPQ